MVTHNILPCQNVEVDPDWTPDSDSNMHIKTSFEVLSKNRNKLHEIYNNEFIAELTRQATNAPDKYRPAKHDCLEPGDVVLLKEPNTKCTNFPMGIITNVTVNSIGEVTKVEIRKGNKEIVKRHVKSLVLLLKNYESRSADLRLGTSDEVPNVADSRLGTSDGVPNVAAEVRPKRRAAIECRSRVAGLIDDDLV